jgi:amino-acid N-acetyltransferase
MTIRKARISDASGICGLINYYAERGRMLHRSLESVYDSLREFQVVQDEDEQIVGCVAVDVFWADLAEIKSLAVAPRCRGQGLGGRLVEAAVADACTLGVKRLFALTYEKDFFLHHGFELVDRQCLPEKVWRECIACPRADACDEIAVMRSIDEDGRPR